MTDSNAVYVASGFLPKGGVSSLRDVPAADFIAAYAAHLKKGGKIELPEWVDVVKTARKFVVLVLVNCIADLTGLASCSWTGAPPNGPRLVLHSRCIDRP